jgi:hypothetical protein
MAADSADKSKRTGRLYLMLVAAVPRNTFSEPVKYLINRGSIFTIDGIVVVFLTGLEDLFYRLQKFFLVVRHAASRSGTFPCISQVSPSCRASSLLSLSTRK